MVSFTPVTPPPGHGSVGPVGPITCTHAGANVCSADVVFTPDADFNGAAGFSYTASDGTDTSPPANVAITILPDNDTPDADSGTRTTDEDTALALNLGALVNDVETGDANLTYEFVTLPAHGSLSGSGASRTYTPDLDYNGPDSLTYRVTDRGDPDGCGSLGADCDGSETSTHRDGVDHRQPGQRRAGGHGG